MTMKLLGMKIVSFGDRFRIIGTIIFPISNPIGGMTWSTIFLLPKILWRITVSNPSVTSNGVWNQPETEQIFRTADEALNYMVGPDRLRDVITKVTVLDRTI